MKLSLIEWFSIVLIVLSTGLSIQSVSTRWQADAARPPAVAQPGDFCRPDQGLSGFSNEGVPVCRRRLTK